MKTIRVTVPATGKKWKVSFQGRTPFARVSSTGAYNLVERKILNSLRTWAKEKTKIYVCYGQVYGDKATGGTNEGIYDNPYEALYSLACFLEDYASHDFLLSKYKKYYPKFTGEKYL